MLLLYLCFPFPVRIRLTGNGLKIIASTWAVSVVFVVDSEDDHFILGAQLQCFQREGEQLVAQAGRYYSFIINANRLVCIGEESMFRSGVSLLGQRGIPDCEGSQLWHIISAKENR